MIDRRLQAMTAAAQSSLASRPPIGFKHARTCALNAGAVRDNSRRDDGPLQ
jgi:hypothetical protein